MRLRAAGAVFLAFAMVAAAIGIIASRALIPGFARLTGDGAPTAAIGATTMGASTLHALLSRDD